MLQGVGLRFQTYPPSSPGERFQKCAVSVRVVSIKTAAMWKKRKARNYKMFSSFQRNLSLCKRALRSQKKTKNKKQTKLFSFSFVFHFLPRTEIIVFFSVSFKHSSKVEATLLELFSPERKWRLPCVHVSVKKENKTKKTRVSCCHGYRLLDDLIPVSFFPMSFFPPEAERH